MDDVVGDEEPTPPTASMISRFKGGRVFLVMVLLTVNVLNYMDRFTIAGVLTDLQSYFRIDDSQAGFLQTVFIVFYMLCAPVCGFLGDRVNRKLIMAVGLTVWIVAVLLSSFVGREHFHVFLFLRGLVGVGEASYSTVAPTLIADSFIGRSRSIFLMVFYFAIPVGSGLGYVVGSYVTLWFGSWQWGVRVTPLLGFLCLLLLTITVEEPQRGQADHAQLEPTSPKEDLIYLISVPTFRLTTLAFTAVVFAVGALSWWTPTLVEHAYAIEQGSRVVPASEKAHVAAIFGFITCLAGIVGVSIGSLAAQQWREGGAIIKANHAADSLVCAAGSLLAVPFLFTSLILVSHFPTVAWFFMFIAVSCMCLNWAVNMDILMYVTVANRRATATALQTLVGHLFGDASSPYLIGLLSDAFRGILFLVFTQFSANDESSAGQFFALRSALFLPAFLLVLSGGFYLWSSMHLVRDRNAAAHAMHVASGWEQDEDESPVDDAQLLS